MANITPVVTSVSPENPNAGYKVVWASVAAADVPLATPSNLSVFTDRTIQVDGTFDSVTVVLKGSNDGTNYVALTDPQGNSISKTSAAIEQVEEATIFVKPTHSGGGGSQSYTVTMFFTGFRVR